MIYTVPSTGGFLKKTILFSGFRNPYEKSAEISKFESIHKKAFCRLKNAGTKPDKNSSLSRLEFMPKNLD
jgi:hypothetical protein